MTLAVTNIVRKKTATVEVEMPKVGDDVMILDIGGSHAFPVCIGSVQSNVPWKEATDGS